MARDAPERQQGVVGLIGIGLVGTALAERFLAAGRTVLGFDIDPSALSRFERLGGRPATGPIDVVEHCDRVVLSLPNSAIVAAIIDLVAPSLRSGQTLIDTTTGAPDDAVAAGEILKGRGVVYLDATISGSSEQVRRGEAVVIVGGDAAAVAICSDLFHGFSKAVHHVGPLGSGSRMKLVSNLVLGLNRAALAEGLGLAQAWGLDLDQTLTVLRESASYSRAMDVKGPKMVQRDFTPEARLAQHHKDVRILLESARRIHARLPLSQVHEKLLEEAEAAGLGTLDNAAIIEVLLNERSD